MAKADGRSSDELLAMYALEGFLDRLSTSPRADDLVLKGGVLLAVYDTRRPTRDIDLPATNLAGDSDTVLELVRDITAVHKDDGLVFDAGSATAEVIRDEEEYSGVRVRLIGHLSRARIALHVDVNVGDPIVPRQYRSRYLAFSGEPSQCVDTRYPWCLPRRSLRQSNAGRSTLAGVTTPTSPSSAPGTMSTATRSQPPSMWSPGTAMPP